MTRRLLQFLAFVLLPSVLLADEIPAVLDWSQRVVLSTPVSGVVASVPVEPGQAVSAGQVLLALDDRRLRAQRERARAQVERLKLTVDEAEREYARARELYDRTVISVRDLQLAKIDLAMARAEYAAAQAELTSASIDLEHSTLRAPFDGIVLRAHVAKGETVANTLKATPMISLAASGTMLARAKIDEARLKELRVGQPIDVTVGSQRFTGVLSQIGLEPASTEQGARYEIFVSFEPSDSDRPRNGQGARLALP
jgi:multidrug efflux system membrane fusion protein